MGAPPPEAGATMTRRWRDTHDGTHPTPEQLLVGWFVGEMNPDGVSKTTRSDWGRRQDK